MKKKLFVEGMKCENCAKHVQEALNSLEGVINVDIDLANKFAIIETASEISAEAFELAVNSDKYKVVRIEKV